MVSNSRQEIGMYLLLCTIIDSEGQMIAKTPSEWQLGLSDCCCTVDGIGCRLQVTMGKGLDGAESDE